MQKGAGHGHGEGHSGPIAACPAATCGDDAEQGASHTANTAGTSLAQEDVRGSGAGDHWEISDLHHGGDVIGSNNHRCASPTSQWRRSSRGRRRKEGTLQCCQLDRTETATLLTRG